MVALAAVMGVFAFVAVVLLSLVQHASVEDTIPRAVGALVAFATLGLCVGAIGRRVLSEAFRNEEASEGYENAPPLAKEIAGVHARIDEERKDAPVGSP